MDAFVPQLFILIGFTVTMGVILIVLCAVYAPNVTKPVIDMVIKIVYALLRRDLPPPPDEPPASG